jgi:hypothetical protein
MLAQAGNYADWVYWRNSSVEYDNSSPAKSAIPCFTNDRTKDLDLVRTLLVKYFDSGDACVFISRIEIFEVCEKFVSAITTMIISDSQLWENGDDILLVNMILATASRRLEPNDPILIQTMLNSTQLAAKFFDHVTFLFNRISADTVRTVQAFILSFEHLFHLRLLEKAWEVLFKCVGAAYALGLHIVEKDMEKIRY